VLSPSNDARTESPKGNDRRRRLLWPQKTPSMFLLNKSFALTRRLQHFLGHASITNTVRYTAMSPEPFKDVWR
jgi:hypothetical protein